jgi:type IV pilus assembly protein PilQ
MSATRSGEVAGRLVPAVLGLVLLAACAGPAAVSEPKPGEPAAVAAAPAPGTPALEPAAPQAVPLPTEEERAAAEKALREAEEAAKAPPEPAKPVGPITVTGIEIRDVEPTGAVVVLTADRPFGGYESFSLPEPPRLIIDLPEATHAVKRPVAVPKGGPIKRLRSSQYKVKPVKSMRLVLDLASNLPYQVQTKNGQFHVLIGDAIAKAGAPEAPTPAEAAPAPAEPPAPAGPVITEAEGKVTGVTFKPADGRSQILIRTEGRVSFNLTELKDPPKLVVDVAGATIGAGVSRSLEVAQMPGPVERVRAAQFRTQPEKMVRVVADLKQRVRYEAVQSPTGITLELREPAVATPPVPAAPAAPMMAEMPRPAPPAAPASAAPAPPGAEPDPAAPATAPPVPPGAAPPAPAPPVAAARPPGARPGRLSMDFKDADINNLLRIIAEVSGQNIVAGDEVKGKVTVRLVDVDWEKALETILRINNLDYVWEENIIRVASAGKLEAERAARAKATLAVQDVKRAAPLKTEILKVNYAKPADVVKALDKIKTPARGSISVDDRTASLIIEDTEETIRSMKKLLAELDVPTPQVMIEARLVEILANHSRELGIEWGGRYNPGFSGTGSQIGISDIFGAATGNITNLAAVAGQTGFLADQTIPRAINLPATNTAGGIGITFGRADGRLVLGARLSLFETQGKSRTLSTPRITTLDNEEAEIKVGTQVPFTTVDSSGRTVIAFQDAFLRLKVTPHVTADKHVSMKIEAENTTQGTRIDFSGGFAFPLNTRKATTRLLVGDGSTAVIGGLVQTTESTTENKVPWLGNIPVLGWLFKNRSEFIEPTRTELLIFITPSLVEEIRQVRR